MKSNKSSKGRLATRGRVAAGFLAMLLPHSVEAVAGGPEEPVYAWATSVDRIGMRFGAVVSRAGRPATSEQGRNVFKIGGCEVVIYEDQGLVARIEAPVTTKCHPQPEGRAVTPATTFGQVFRSSSRYYAMCLAECGDTDQPLLAVSQSGTSSGRDWSAHYEGGSVAAERAWREAIEAKAAPPGASEAFIDVLNPPAPVVRLLQSTKVRRVTLARRYKGAVAPSGN